MVDFYTQTISKHWYYSNFFPEKHFDTDEDAINFEKSLVMGSLPKVLSCWERDGAVDSESNKWASYKAEPWTIDANDNYQTPTNTPGFKQIPFVYKTKKCFIEIEQDSISYYYFNEDTMQYELLEQITENDEDYIHNCVFTDFLCTENVESNMKNSTYFGRVNSPYALIVKDSIGIIEKPYVENTIYYIKEDDNFYKKKTDEDELELVQDKSIYTQYMKQVLINDEGTIVGLADYDGTSPKEIAEILSHYDANFEGKVGKYYYWSDEEYVVQYMGKDSYKIVYDFSENATDSSGNKITWIFTKRTTVTEGYLDLQQEVTPDKWYVRICRNIYSTFSWIWRGLKKIGKAIGTFFKNLWNYLKGQTYYGTEIQFYWGTNTIAIESLDSLTQYDDNEIAYQSYETPRKYWKFNGSGWEKINAAKWERAFSTTGHPEYVVSRYKDLSSKGNGYWYVTQTQSFYSKNGTTIKKLPVISDELIKLLGNGRKLKQECIFYCEKEGQCYKWNSTREKWVEDQEHSSMDGLYEACDAIRLVLNYQDKIYSTVFKDFNSIITTLNDTMGYSFPTYTNTLRPQNENDYGDWGFFYYDKVKGWITGKEAHELEIL